MPSKAIVRHCKAAKADIAKGESAFRSAAGHIHAAVKSGCTQTEVAALIGMSQSWVNRLLKWRQNGFKADGPFAEDHARAIISAANNPPPAAQAVNVRVTTETRLLKVNSYKAEPEETRPVGVVYQSEPEPDRAPPRPTPQALREQLDRMFGFLLAYFNDDAVAMWVAVDLYRAEHPIAPVTLDAVPRGDGALH